MQKKVVVIDYGIGNVYSVCNALNKIGVDAVLSSDHSVIMSANKVILPGVGSFCSAMKLLNSSGLNEAIANFIYTGRPFLGICLGMQLLMECSNEVSSCEGLGHIKGSVDLIPNNTPNGHRLAIPHVSWAEVRPTNKISYNQISYDPNSPGKNYFYFVHSYMCKPNCDQEVLGLSMYGGNPITAVIGKDNITGVQFHPERSGIAGLLFLEKFVTDEENS